MSRKLYYGLFVSLLIASVLSPWASPNPDGLEKVVEERNFLAGAESQKVLAPPIPDYVMPGIGNDSVATGAAGAVGTLLTFGLVVGIRGLLVKRKTGSSGHSIGKG